LQLSAVYVEKMLSLFPDSSVHQEMTPVIGRFQIQGREALKAMMLMSGGQKSRVAFAAFA
jgi:ATP-binding cassette subfamily F protein 3